jgi:hypothetical protein
MGSCSPLYLLGRTPPQKDAAAIRAQRKTIRFFVSIKKDSTSFRFECKKAQSKVIFIAFILLIIFELAPALS